MNAGEMIQVHKINNQAIKKKQLQMEGSVFVSFCFVVEWLIMN